MPSRQHTRAKLRPQPVSWLIRHRRLILGLVIAVSIATRLAYFLQLNATPFIHMEQWRQTDMHYYDGWARQIAAGDWWSASLRLPMHRWHREIAAQHFAAHPDVKPALEADRTRVGDAAEAAEAVWSRWMRVPQFYQDPLYAYVIAAIYKLARADVRAVLVGQLAVGVLSNVLIWALARRFFGDAVAAVAGALAVLCAPLMFYELLLLRDSMMVFTGLGLIWLLDRAVEGRSWGWSGALGVALGAACLLKGTFVLLAIAVLLVLGIRARLRDRAAILRVAAVTVGLAMPVSLAVVRNVAVDAAPLSFASSGPLTFVSSNSVWAQPDMGFGIDVPHLTNFLGTTDGGWQAAFARVLGPHTIGSYGALLWRKWDRMWHWFEIPNNENFYYLRTQARVLAWLPVTFWAIAPLALVGLVLGAPRWRDVWALYVLAAASAAPLILFYVLGRFRVSFLAALLPFAALTIVEIVGSLRMGRTGRSFALAGAVLGIFLWTGRPLASQQRMLRTADWILAWSVRYEGEVYGALDAKNPARAAAAYLEFFTYEPTEDQVRASGDPQTAAELADMHNECAQILRLSGQAVLAEAQVQRAKRWLEVRAGL